MSASDSYTVSDLCRWLDSARLFKGHEPVKHLAYEDLVKVLELAIKGAGVRPEGDEVRNLIRDILNLPENSAWLENLSRGIGTHSRFAVLLKAKAFVERSDATHGEGAK